MAYQAPALPANGIVQSSDDVLRMLAEDDGSGGLQMKVGAASGPPSSLFSGTKTVSDTGTPEAIEASQALARGVYVTANTTNTATCFVGNASTQLTPLSAGQTIYVEIDNLSKVYIDVGVNGEGVTYLAS